MRTPPTLARRLLEWYADRAAIEDLVGDADEVFQSDVEKFSLNRARWNYWKNILSLVFSYALKKRRRQASLYAYSSNSFQFSMFKNYFLIAWRSLAKHRMFTAINVIGLAVGMSIGLLFISMVSFIYSYDNFHIRKDSIYRVITHTDDKQNNYDYASAPAVLSTYLEDFSGVESVVRISATLGGEIAFREKGIELSGYFVDPAFLEVFTFPLSRGDARNALNGPNKIVITETTAIKFFGSEDAIGKTLEVPGHGLFDVTGVLKDLPKNSHLVFDILASYESLGSNMNDQTDHWREFRNNYVYLVVNDPPHRSSIESSLNELAGNVYSENESLRASFELQALTEISPGPDLYDQIGPDWGYGSLLIFGILCLLILAPACFNYANISISRALKRMKEIGLRKVMGGMRGQIFMQFIIETVIVTLLALVLAYILFDFIKGEFLNLIVMGNETLDLTPDLQTILLFVGFTIVVGTVAGIVPALHFSRLTPIQALNTKNVKSKFSRITLRKSFVVLQFVLSLGFIMTVVIVLNQYRYALNYDFGFQQSNIVDVELQGVNYETLATEFEKNAAVVSVSMSSNVIGTGASNLQWIRDVASGDSSAVFSASIDENYLDNIGLELLAGENFIVGSIANQSKVIVNETFVSTFQLENLYDAVGQTFILTYGKEVVIAGVVKDFNYGSLREPISSFMFEFDQAKFNYINLKIASSNMYKDMSELETIWKAVEPNKRFKARFLDDEISDAFEVYFSMVRLCGFLGFLAITITCLGLLGMVVFTVENRVKEVGIRKVMGASVMSVVLLLSKDFLKIMAIAAVIAIPGTYFLIGKMYLAQIQYYRLEVGITEILISLFIMLILGLSTILSQTWRAAQANPVDTLRQE